VVGGRWPVARHLPLILGTQFLTNVPEGTQLRFVKVFLQERLWKTTKKWMGGKPFIGSDLWVIADISAASVAK
jgi:hypothetical protein